MVNSSFSVETWVKHSWTQYESSTVSAPHLPSFVLLCDTGNEPSADFSPLSARTILASVNRGHWSDTAKKTGGKALLPFSFRAGARQPSQTSQLPNSSTEQVPTHQVTSYEQLRVPFPQQLWPCPQATFSHSVGWFYRSFPAPTHLLAMTSFSQRLALACTIRSELPTADLIFLWQPSPLQKG